MHTEEDINLALFDVRVTPSDGNIPNPGELIFNRKLATVLPNHGEVSSKDQYAREQMPDYYNNVHRHPLPPLMKHQDVCVLDNDKWIPGRKEPRSYIMQCQTRHLSRNRSHIWPSGNNNRPDQDYMPSFVESNDVSANFKIMQKIGEIKVVITKKGRVIRKPDRRWVINLFLLLNHMHPQIKTIDIRL